jgi:ectoine hydroxylase-related dioxygenase (phytanoyl-CoA dioxygenase family)
MTAPTAFIRSAPGQQQTWLSREDCDLADFRALVEVPTQLADYPHADSTDRNVLIYGAVLRELLDSGADRRAVQAELVQALMDGPGIVVFKHAFTDTTVIDRATEAFNELIDDQKARGVAGGDHFAPPGANDRVWNALEKLAVHRPEVFADYYSNDILALVSAAWLGPNYQMTSALNVVNPGGKAQTAHRDYHLGFMPLATAAGFPAHVHRLSPVLTLQGAVAHCDMPVVTGPTLYLPNSQKYLPGYLATDLPEFVDYFQENYVQLPLEKGDVVFFNPALFHGAGTNNSADVKRMANLLQVSSAFGRALETVDRTTVCTALYPTLLARKQAGAPSAALHNIIASAAEGYPFPTNLDLDQPIGSLNPETQAELTWRALQEDWDGNTYVAALRAQEARHRSS